MDEQWIYLTGTLIVVDIIVIVAGAMPYLFGAKIGCRWRKLLWLILAVRLLVPVRLVMNRVYVDRPSYFVQVDVPAGYGTRGQPDQEKAQETGGLEIQESMGNTDGYQTDPGKILPPQQSFADPAATATADSVMGRNAGSGWIPLVIWMSGAFALTVYHTIGFLRIRKLIKMQSHCCADPHTNDQVEKLCGEYQMRSVPQVFICGQVSSPMLFGYMHTRLLMPDKPYTGMELYLILRHELQHKKSGDLWYKLLVMFVCDIYWFNPAMILMKRLAYQDVECVCDARVMRCLTAGERKLYGKIVLDNMAGDRERAIVYGTSVFTGKRAAELRIKNMFTEKNKLGFVILGVLVVCAVAGSSMWVLSGQDGEGHAAQDNVYTVVAGDMEDISRAKDLNCVNCYTTEIVRGGNHYWIDGQGTLWGTGSSGNGQLMEVREDPGRVTEPVEIAQHVKHVDYSGEYFVIYLTEDNQLYGLGGNPASVLHRAVMEDYRPVITEPVLVMENVIYAKCGDSTIIALTENGEVCMRGEMKYVPFSGDIYREPAKVMENAKYVTACGNTFAVIDNNDSLWTWGDNGLGQCGVGNFSAQVQSPQKVMEHVECAWMGRAAFNSADETDVRARHNLIVLMKDGTFYGCGEGIGEERLPGGIDGMDGAQEVTASEKLVPVSIQ